MIRRMHTTLYKLAALALTGTLALGLGKPAFAGASGGPKRDANSVPAGYERTYHIRFRGQEMARVAASGDGDIDIRVYDADGHLVARDTASDFEPVAEWYVEEGQTYTIKVINADDYEVDYGFATN